MPRDEREVALQIHILLNMVVKIAQHQKCVTRNSDKGIKYWRQGNMWHEEWSLDINIGRVEHIFLNRNVGIESMGDTLLRGSLPQVAGDPATSSLESKMVIYHSWEMCSLNSKGVYVLMKVHQFFALLFGANRR